MLPTTPPPSGCGSLRPGQCQPPPLPEVSSWESWGNRRYSPTLRFCQLTKRKPSLWWWTLDMHFFRLVQSALLNVFFQVQSALNAYTCKHLHCKEFTMSRIRCGRVVRRCYHTTIFIAFNEQLMVFLIGHWVNIHSPFFRIPTMQLLMIPMRRSLRSSLMRWRTWECTG